MPTHRPKESERRGMGRYEWYAVMLVVFWIGLLIAALVLGDHAMYND